MHYIVMRRDPFATSTPKLMDLERQGCLTPGVDRPEPGGADGWAGGWISPKPSWWTGRLGPSRTPGQAPQPLWRFKLRRDEAGKALIYGRARMGDQGKTHWRTCVGKEIDESV